MANTANQVSYTNDFDFTKYYEQIKDTPAGLRLFLAQQLLENAADMMGRAQKDLRAQTEDLADEVKALRESRRKFYEQQERSPNVKG
jgi:hypothetical protein